MRLRWLSVVAGLGLGLSSCSFDEGGVQPDGNGTPPDASVDAVPPVCTPGCEGDILVTCPDGVAQRAECDLGCVADATPHCAVMVPSNGVSIGDLDVVPMDRPFVVPEGATYTIDTDTGRILDEENRQVRPATAAGAVHEGTGTFFGRRGETLSLFAVDALDVGPGATLKGEGERGLIVLARGAISVRGTIDFSAGCTDGLGAATCGGPGGGDGASITSPAGGCARGGNGAGAPGGGEAGAESGGGGGGLGGSGAAGGRAGSEGMPRAGGAGGQPSNACPGPTLTPLAGGSGGGAGGVGDANGGPGGGGGGAVQLSSFTRIEIDGGAGAPAVVRASGAGGTAPTTAAQGGGGGGSGGALLLEAPVLVIGARTSITANGGGGGSGVLAVTAQDASGEPGTTTETRAGGGDGNDDDEGFGGVGAARSGNAGAGGPALDGGGGGGGGVGIIRINRRTQTFGVNVVISPQQSEGALTVQ